jgi:hypothetical protein
VEPREEDVILSFAWTTPAVRARQKTCTRRQWAESHAHRFITLAARGELIDGWTRSPRVGGTRFCRIKLTEEPVRQWTNEIPDTDWYAEGFDYLQKTGAHVGAVTPQQIWDGWHRTPELLWVVRFEIAELDLEVLDQRGR